MNILQKPLAEVAPEDVRWLVDREIQEGADLEYKQQLATKDGKPDRWVTQGDAVGDNAKSDLVKELVGFANAQGGALILGIQETKTKPSKAKAVTPIPKVGDLAERLKMACRDLIEPKLHSLEVRGIPTESDGSGVVILRVNGGSPLGPHRHRGTKECYLRRNDETVPMDMIEIQRHSIELQQRLLRLDDEFAARRQSFLGSFYPTVSTPRFGMCAIAMPLAPVLSPNLHRTPAARPRPTRIPVKLKGGEPSEAIIHIGEHLNWRPIVRGTAAELRSDGELLTITAMNDGRLVFQWTYRRADAPPGQPQTQVYVGWFAGFFGNVLLAIERMRRASGAPSAEFALEFLYVASRPFPLGDYNDHWHRATGSLPGGDQLFPRYPVGPTEDFNALTQAFETDVLNLAERDLPGEDSIYDYGAALASIERSFATP